ncbi:MAG: type IV toxin-antitoxin system AbiEi family antitoxin [Thermoplasmata archaeon]
MAKKLTTAYILSRLAEEGVRGFTTREFALLFRISRQKAYQILHRLKTRGFVKRLAQGRYAVVGLGDREVLGQPFFLGTRLVEPSYVSFWSALHFYGWTEQAPRLILVANTRRSDQRQIEAYQFRLVRLTPKRFFGYQSTRQGNFEFPMADPAKALVDSLYLPGYAGGVEEVAKALEVALETVNVATLVSYAVQMGVKSLCSRLGFLLEGAGVDSDDLRDAASQVYVKLDPSGPRRGRYDGRWRVIVNLSEGW